MFLFHKGQHMKIIQAQALKKSYGKHTVLNDLSFDIHEQELVALVGVNGSGKSTLIELLCGVKKADGGQLCLFEKTIMKASERLEVKKNIGYMPQHFCLFQDLTVKENLDYMATVYGTNSNAVKQMLDQCYLTDKQHFLAKNLSGGYKQLLSLAAAILHSPKLLILDEPTSAMDPLFRKRFWKIIKDFCAQNGATVLVTTHYMEEIFECNKIMFLSSGKIIHSSTVENIFENGKFASINEVLSFYILKEEGNE